MKKLWSLILSASLIAGLLAGCGGGDSGSTSQSPTASDGTRQMVVAIPGLPDNGDCQNTSSAYNRLGLTQQVYDYLMRKDGDGNVVPNMVESYQMAADASSCSFVLKQGIKFHDGSEVTAEDIAFTIERGKKSTGSVKSYCADISKVDVQDDYHFTIVMGTPNVALLEYLTCIPIMSKAFTESCGDSYGTDVDKIMGCGPYIMTEWKFGEYITYKAFDDYFVGAPDVKSIRLEVISDSNAAVIALQTHEIDLYLNDVPYISTGDLDSDDSVKMEYFSGSRYNYVLFNAEQGMFSDVRMRQAVAYALNRDDMLTLGCEDPSNGYLVNSPAGPDFVANPGSDSWPYTQNIEKAKELVKEAGCEGASTTIYTLSLEPYPKLATKLQDFLTQIGLKCDIVQMENSAYITQVCDEGNFEIAICFNSFPAKDMDIALGAQLLSSKAGLSGNYGRYENSEMDEYLNTAKVITDNDARKAAYQKALDLFAQTLPSVPLYYTKSSRAYSSDLTVEQNCAQYDHLAYYSWAK
jgi:peptide/nickel transport system substrate-binding protein